MSLSNIGSQYDRLPATAAEREVAGRATRREVCEYFADRFGILPTIFDEYTFWEKGKGKIWAFAGDHPSPVVVETLGIHVLRTRQRFWKPTTDGVQRYGSHATRNVVSLSRADAATFWRGETQGLKWTGDPGYVIVCHDLGGNPEPLGVGLAVNDELQSVVPKGRRLALG